MSLEKKIFSNLVSRGVSRRQIFDIAKIIPIRQAYDLSYGGSLVTDVQNWTRLRDYSRTGWLQASPESHLNRVEKQGDWRPMRGFQNAIEDVRRILQERYPLYSQADFIIDTDQLSVEEAVRQLVQFYKKNTQNL